MARNAEVTRERILEAAMAEFSAYGIAGARVDRIAEAADCNKNLIYIYFENKETLFTTVIGKHLARIHDGVPFTPDDLPGYAARVFDFAMAYPDVMRLMAWFGLEQSAVASQKARGTAVAEKIEALSKAQESGLVVRDVPPGFLLVSIMALATAWAAANPFGPSIDREGLEKPKVLRRHIAEAVRRLSAPKAGDA